jgi:hypothetical protein
MQSSSQTEITYTTYKTLNEEEKKELERNLKNIL